MLSREEGLPEYVPVIPLPPQQYINYNQTVEHAAWCSYCSVLFSFAQVEKITGICSAPTGLESTALVFAYGRG